MFAQQQTVQNLKFLKIQKLASKNLGIDMNTLNGKDLLKNKCKFLFLLLCILYVQYGLINYVAYCGITNLDMASGSLSIFNQACLVLLKIFIFRLKGDKFMRLISKINCLAEKANPAEKEKWYLENAQAQLIGKTYFYNCWGVVCCSGFFPLILMAYDFKKGNDFKRTLPFGGRFPAEEKSIFLFILNYILSVIYIYGLLNMTVTVDTLYIWFIHSASAHFRIISCKVEKLASSLHGRECTQFPRQIGLIVTYHNRSLNFAEDLNDIYGEILLAQVLLSCLQMCFAIYTLYNDNNTFNMPLNITVLVAGFMQATIYCFCGEKLKDESFILSTDLYLMMPWQKMSSREKQLMLLPLMRSQKLSLLRGLFFEIDRNLLVYIVKTAFSFNALMSAMNE